MTDEKKPIFIKIKDEYERLIDIGAFKEGDSMPSVREIALNNNVNPNTVQRALTLMVEDGYLLSIPKKGFFVNKAKKGRGEHLKDMVNEILNKGYSREEILKVLKEEK